MSRPRFVQVETTVNTFHYINLDHVIEVVIDYRNDELTITLDNGEQVTVSQEDKVGGNRQREELLEWLDDHCTLPA